MTQGMLTILSRKENPIEDIVLYKIVAGCEGHHEYLQDLAVRLRYLLINKKSEVTLEEIYNISIEYIGCSDCLAIVGQDGVYFKGEDELSELYRKTFDQPYFNPRWECGLGFVLTLILETGVIGTQSETDKK